jgi:hypothetical protein
MHGTPPSGREVPDSGMAFHIAVEHPGPVRTWVVAGAVGAVVVAGVPALALGAFAVAVPLRIRRLRTGQASTRPQ